MNNGNRLVLTPEFSGSVWTTYGLAMGLRLGGGVRQTSAVFINAANTIESPGYTLVDGLAEYEVNRHLTLRAEHLQPVQRDLHPERQQQRRALQPGLSAIGDGQHAVPVLSGLLEC